MTPSLVDSICFPAKTLVEVRFAMAAFVAGVAAAAAAVAAAEAGLRTGRPAGACCTLNWGLGRCADGLGWANPGIGLDRGAAGGGTDVL